MTIIEKIKKLLRGNQSVDNILKGLLKTVKKLETLAEDNIEFADDNITRAQKLEQAAIAYKLEAVRAEKIIENIRKMLEA